VEKYQLTPKSSTEHHLFKIIYRREVQVMPAMANNAAHLATPTTTNKSGRSRQPVPKTKIRKAEVVLKMKSRDELERICDDVKMRVILPSRKSTKNTKSCISEESRKREQRRRKRRQERKEREHIQRQQQQKHGNSVGNSSAGGGSGSRQSQFGDSIPTIASTLSARERSVMLPPSLPRRMTSDRNLLASNHSGVESNHDSSANSQDAPAAPKRPTRKASVTADLEFVNDSEDTSSDDDDHEDDHDKEEDDDDLWAVNDLLEKCRAAKRPVAWRKRLRDAPPTSLLKTKTQQSSPLCGDDDDEQEENELKEKKKDKPIPLLPPEWQTLVAVPLFDIRNIKVKDILVLAVTEKSSEALPKPDISDPEVLDWWVPTVKTLMKDILQQRERLGLMSTKAKTVNELDIKLKDSLRRHSDMIHSILPPMAILKLKVQPQQWKSPLSLIYQQAKPSFVQASSASFANSSISGSLPSRFGYVVGDLTSGDSDSIATGSLHGGTLYGIAENQKDDNKPQIPGRSSSTNTAQLTKQKSISRLGPTRNSSAGNTGLAMRGLSRQGSVRDRSGTTRPIFSRMDSKRGVLMSKRAGSIRNLTLTKQSSGIFGRGGIPRINSLRNLHGGGASVSTGTVASGDDTSVGTFDQSFRTMYNDDDGESIHPEDLSTNQGSTHQLSALSRDISYLTTVANVQYINSSLQVKDVQALYAGKKSNVSIIFVSVLNFHKMQSGLKPGPLMDTLAKLLFTVDRLCEKHRTIKVETFGHMFIIMSGLFMGDDNDAEGMQPDGANLQDQRDQNSAVAALEMAKELVTEAQSIELPKDYIDSSSRIKMPEALAVRVGIHTGEVTYGVVGQNVPKLNCLGHGLAIALRMEQTAAENCIRASKDFHDLVGDNEDGWDEGVEMIDVPRVASVDGTAITTNVIISSSTAGHDVPYWKTNGFSAARMETFTLEPPPAISDIGASSVASGLPSLSAWESNSYVPDTGFPAMLGEEFQESFVSGEFFVD